MKYLRNWWSSVDRLNFMLIISLGFTGLILSFSIDEFFSMNKHTIFFVLSLIFLFILSQFNNKNIRRVSLFAFILLLILMIIIFFLDYEVKGAKRWIQILNFTLQPSEIIKPVFVILSAWCISKSIEDKKFYLPILFIFFFLLLILIIMQPDLGMTVLISSTFFCQLFVAGLSLFLVFLAFLFILFISIFSYFIFDHVQSRINSFLGGISGSDTYQIDLSIKAFQNGGLLGKGPGQGILKERIPDANTDFIFAVAGEELGLIFCLVIILIILSIIVRTLINVLKVEDTYKIIAISGLICSFGLQCLINIFSSLGLIPTKGMTLPFVSYGGSSMISVSILFGFLLSLTNKKNENL
jgi:cell division protein FtsW